MEAVRFGIIGLGTIARKFAAALALAEGVELAAVAARDASRADLFAKEFGAKRAYGSYLDLIRDVNVDVVYIALTHNFHFEYAKLCVEAGKAVICEKPFFTNQAEAEVLVKLAQDTKVLMMEAMWTRCLPAFQQAKSWVKNRKIGEVKLIQASFSFNATSLGPSHRLFDPALAGGSLWDAGVYPIEFATGILDEKPTTVKGIARIGETGVDTQVAMLLGWDSGALATLSCGVTVKTSPDAYIYGTNGHIVVDNFLGTHMTERYDAKGVLVERFEEMFENGFVYQILHFADLFRGKKTESDWIPLRDTVVCAWIFDTLREQF